MIKLERPTKVPRSLLSPKSRELQADAAKWAETVSKVSRSKSIAQVSFKSAEQTISMADVRQALTRAQFGKCAFCEAPITREMRQGDLTLFRPASSTVDLNGISSLPHYAWLCVEWHNLHLTCTACNLNKGKRFPVEGKRAPVNTPWPDLASREQAMLLDPYVDHPDEHLIFDRETGRVISKTERGRATIDVFSLNRDGLFEERRRAVADALMTFRAGKGEEAVAAHHPYAAARRQAIREVAERDSETLESVVDVGEHVVVSGVAIRKVTAREELDALADDDRAQDAQNAYSLESPSGNQSYYATTKYVHAVEVTNWKAIKRVRIEVPQAVTERAPWFTMLGENGAGKSSLVQAIALALLGERSRDTLGLRPNEFIRNGAQRAEVKVWLTGIPEPCVVTARRGETRFGGSSDPKVLVLAYGATRLLPRPGDPDVPQATADIADVDNLFNPFVPMTDANAWLLGRPDPQFDAAARALRALLDLHGTDMLMRFRKAGEVRCRTLGAVVPLDRMSDGYQSVVATACDIMAVLMSRWADMSAAEGIVLLDELGAHLHPRWRMRVVSTLRTVFPRVQFLVTTHDPLCLRGLEDGEVALVERLTDKDATVVVHQDLPSIAGLRADQLLTSELFGLRSAMDPDVEVLFNEYYALLALRRPRRAQQRRIAELGDKLAGLHLMGDTVRERLVFESADKWLATQAATNTASSVRENNEAAVAMLAEVWAEVAPARFASGKA